MATFVCSKCKYKVRKETAPKRCPYCGAKGVMMKEKNAQDLLEDVTAETKQIDKEKAEREI